MSIEKFHLCSKSNKIAVALLVIIACVESITTGTRVKTVSKNKSTNASDDFDSESEKLKASQEISRRLYNYDKESSLSSKSVNGIDGVIMLLFEKSSIPIHQQENVYEQLETKLQQYRNTNTEFKSWASLFKSMPVEQLSAFKKQLSDFKLDSIIVVPTKNCPEGYRLNVDGKCKEVVDFKTPSADESENEISDV